MIRAIKFQQYVVATTMKIKITFENMYLILYYS